MYARRSCACLLAVLLTGTALGAPVPAVTLDKAA
jgi:hypothetical protein